MMRFKKRQRKAQTFLEYILLIGIVVMIYTAMMVFIRRSTQGMVKLMADQVGVQRNADQDEGDSGYLAYINSESIVRHRERVVERLDEITYYPDDYTETISEQMSTNGYQE
jgi:hypothetical protein